jgi:hypothetical protein
MQYYDPGTIIESASFWKRELRTHTAYLESLQKLVIKLEEENILLKEELRKMKSSEKDEVSLIEISPKKKKHESRGTSTPPGNTPEVSEPSQV